MVTENVDAADGWLSGKYKNFMLLLRSLRACSLGVVLVKVARNSYIYPGDPGRSIHVFCIFTLQIYILQNEANFSSLVGHFDAFVAAHGDKCSAFLHAGEGALADADGEGVLFVVPG